MPEFRSSALLLRSGWQTVNIGNIAHTPGMLALLQRCFPSSRGIRWCGSVDRGVDGMLSRRFPSLRFLPAEPRYASRHDLSVEKPFA